MQYFGGKFRIAKSIVDFISPRVKGRVFVDAFCGSCNVVSKMRGARIANDKHKYLIAMFKGLQGGWIPPDYVSEDEYYKIKDNQDENPALAGFVGFSCSFAGKWWGGYARNSRGDNYCLQSKRNLLKKFEYLKDVEFFCGDYFDIPIPLGAVVYCDIPYKNSTPYNSKEVGVFSHEVFYTWIRENRDKFSVFVSEYKENIPEDFKVVWEYCSNKEIRDKNNNRKETVEVLAVLNA